MLGLVGTALGASAFNWISPTHSIIALISVGPVVAFLAIAAGQAVKRAILSNAEDGVISVAALLEKVQHWAERRLVVAWN